MIYEIFKMYKKYIGQLLTFSEANELIYKWRNEEKRIVFTNGYFDILHIGHTKLLNAAAL